MSGGKVLRFYPYLPHNRQEHDNEMRALIGKHMGADFSNPTQWVVDACHEAFQMGFQRAMDAGVRAAPQAAAETHPRPAGRVGWDKGVKRIEHPRRRASDRVDDDVIEG